MSIKCKEAKQEELESRIKQKYNLTVSDISKFLSKKSKKKNILTEEEVLILSCKFAINGETTKHTLNEIGEKLKFSESTISRKMHVALLKIYSVRY